MRFPREFFVGDNLWRLRFVRHIDQVPDTETSFTWGYCCGETQTIYIRQRLTFHERLDTLIHELIHAIEFEYGLDIPHRLIHLLEAPVRRLLLDNFL